MDHRETPPTTSEKLDRIYEEFAAAIAHTVRVMSIDIGARLNAEGEKDQVVRDYVVECRDRFFPCELRIKPLGYTPPRINFSDFSEPADTEKNAGNGNETNG
ncbi:hypothetical protein [Candidatus Burkholderia verschuerenii]|uniref:hypothetical protein n=1 Tax=Candidatus Burkholderia verschuerenii TaxID=242163 RepID=UPI0012EE42C2|nr:hypothetical protein [Candidatus Burkholderia verschuerenii]